MKKLLISFIALSVFVGGLQIILSKPEPQFGAFGDPFISIQLATSPSSGKCLKTDGTDNNWGDCAAGGSGATSLGELSDVATTTATLGDLLSLQSDGTYDNTSTSTLNISYADLTNISVDISADTNLTVTSPITLTGDDIGLDDSGTWSGVASTCTALASNPTDCAANQFAQSIVASGNLTCAAIGDADVPDTITVSNYVRTSTWTDHNNYPAACNAGEYVNTIGDTLTCTDATTEINSAISTHMAIIADTNTTGHLNDTDWDTFNNKQAALGYTPVNSADWTTNNSYPAACTNQFVRALGDTNTCATVDMSADTNLTAGRSLTMSADSVIADVELYTDTSCIYFEDPVAADDFNSIWANKTANALTLTELWAESDQTVTFMLQVDDGTPADIDTVDLAPAAGEAEDTSLDGDTTLAAGEELDLAITSVANTPTWVSICWTYTWND